MSKQALLQVPYSVQQLYQLHNALSHQKQLIVCHDTFVWTRSSCKFPLVQRLDQFCHYLFDELLATVVNRDQKEVNVHHSKNRRVTLTTTHFDLMFLLGSHQVQSMSQNNRMKKAQLDYQTFHVDIINTFEHF